MSDSMSAGSMATASTAAGDQSRPAPARCRLGAEDAAGAGAGDADADRAVLHAGDEDAGHGVARGRIAELGVGGLGRHREGDPGDDLALLQRGGEQAGEEILRRERALVGVDGGAEGQHGGRIIGGGIVVGERAADGAHLAHGRIADHAGKRGERRDGLLHRLPTHGPRHG